MWAVLLQVLAVAVGWQVVRQLPLTWRRLEALAASVAVGFAVAPWTFFILAGLFGWNVAMPAGIIILVLGTIISQWRLPRRAKITSEKYGGGRWWRVAGWLVAAVAVVAVSALTLKSYSFPASGAWMSNGNVWGDSPLHVALTNLFSHGNKLDLVSPVYERVPLTYPLIGDLWSGVLMRLTSSWTIGLMLPSLVILLALLQLLFSFAYRLLGSAYGAWLSWLMIVFSGSFFGGFKLVWVWLTQGYAAYKTALGFSFATSTGDNYLNFLHSHPLPQRTYGFGMVLAIVIASVALELYRNRHTQAGRRDRKVAGIIAGVLLGLLPLVHTHSFMILVGVLGLATVGLAWFERKLPVGWAWMCGIGLFIAAPQVVWQFSSTYHGGFTHVIWGWMMVNFVPVRQNWFYFWFHNIGWLFVMMIAGWYWLRRAHVKPEIWLVYVSGVLIFLICNVYAFQPSLWDNMKFFEYGFWLTMLATAAVMTYWRQVWWGHLATAGLMLTLCLTGILTLLVSGPTLNFELLNADEVQFGEQMNRDLPPNAYILVGDRHNSPITMLANRKVLMTFAGWYNLYGGDWATTYADRGLMLSGSDNTPTLIAKYGLNTAAFSDSQVATGEANLVYFHSHYRLFFSGDSWWVFDLTKPATP